MAAALNLRMGLENTGPRFEEGSLSRLEACMFDMPSNQGIELPQVCGGAVGTGLYRASAAGCGGVCLWKHVGSGHGWSNYHTLG